MNDMRKGKPSERIAEICDKLAFEHFHEWSRDRIFYEAIVQYLDEQAAKEEGTGE